MKKKNAFTLLEMILTLAILSFVLLVISQKLLGDIKLFNDTTKKQEDQQEALLIKSYLQDVLISSEDLIAICNDSDSFLEFSDDIEEIENCQFVILKTPIFESEANNEYDSYVIYLKKGDLDLENQRLLYLAYFNRNGSNFENLNSAQKINLIKNNSTNMEIGRNISLFKVQALKNKSNNKVEGISLIFKTKEGENAQVSIGFRN
jgi:prepilin-type N-terminal cleavage/methylation domain-containing protein